MTFIVGAALVFIILTSVSLMTMSAALFVLTMKILVTFLREVYGDKKSGVDTDHMTG